MAICLTARYCFFMLSVLTAVFFYACEKDEDPSRDSDFDADIGQSVDKMINASEGGQLSTGSMTLVIPPNALPDDVVISFGVTGEEPESVPNDHLDVKLQPFTVDIPVDTIFEPLKIIIESTSGSYNEDWAVAGYNGNSYFPYFYESSGNELSIEIDVLSWDAPDKVFAPIIIFILNQKQTPPSDMKGLKEVTVSNNQLVYNTIPDVNEDSKVLIMIHGWIGSPETWTDFVPKIQSSSKVEYTNYWTYGYNSSHSIDSNGEAFANLIKQVSNGAHIDIVAHSMGGLVSRAALENHNAVDNVNSLITLGTPHLGSSLAVTRYIIGYIIATSSPLDLFSYNASSQGYKDLNTGSSFIIQMGNNPASTIPYHTIACVNNPNKWLLSYSWLLPGPDDGIVTVESAKTVSGATSPTNEVFIDIGKAHTVMTENDDLFDQVVEFLSNDQGPGANCYVEGPDGFTYTLTSNEYDVLEVDLSQAVINEFGANAMVADWNDLKTHFSNDIASFLDGICVFSDADLGVTSATILRDGQGFYSGNRHYYMRRFDGEVSSGWAVHDHIDNYTLCLGSWWGTRKILVKFPTSK